MFPCPGTKLLGVTLWVGFELLHRSYKQGISRSRAEWFIKWTREVAATDYVLMSKFEKLLGRIMYVAGALEFERPFLAPLYRFMNLHSCDSVRRVPAYVSFILQYLAVQVEEERHYACASKLRPAATATRWMHRQATGGLELEDGCPHSTRMVSLTQHDHPGSRWKS